MLKKIVKPMDWFLFTLILIILLALVFTLITDGRYFGKRFVFWVYDRIGSRMFSAADDADVWIALAQQIPLRGDERILDVGTAVGNLPLTLVTTPTFKGHVTGIDWSPRMIATAVATVKAKGLETRAYFQVVDIRNGLPFKDAQFDVIFCLGLLETWPYPEKIIAEMKRLLAKDGIFVFSVYKGVASKSVALGEAWYRTTLSNLGMQNARIAPCRHNHDVIIAR
ncbi:MAG: class I SAM-dependent methyltransferase [Chloroflexi bacterium]|nr:class I SAM-dependent methyltransferase [Chloroflexota bacterium]